MGIHPKQMKSLPYEDTCTPTFTEVLFRVVKMWGQPKCPSMDEMHKEGLVYRYNAEFNPENDCVTCHNMSKPGQHYTR
jgi:hypothetical protein